MKKDILIICFILLFMFLSGEEKTKYILYEIQDFIVKKNILYCITIYKYNYCNRHIFLERYDIENNFSTTFDFKIENSYYDRIRIVPGNAKGYEDIIIIEEYGEN